MAVLVKIPTQLRAVTDGEAEAEVDGGTVGEVLDSLFDRFAELRDRICDDGEYPVMGAANPAGGMCVPNGEEPPGGYVRYPAGKVPQHVDDKWDLCRNGVVAYSRYG